MRILAIDDEKDTLDFLREVLSQAGHEVSTAATAGEAMVYIQLTRFDAVLLDLMMPGLDGHQFQKWMREHWDVSDTPVVVISCLTDAQNKQQARIDGCFDYLEKPFQTRRLFEILDRLERGQTQGAGLEAI